MNKHWCPICYAEVKDCECVKVTLSKPAPKHKPRKGEKPYYPHHLDALKSSDDEEWIEVKSPYKDYR